MVQICLNRSEYGPNMDRIRPDMAEYDQKKVANSHCARVKVLATSPTKFKAFAHAHTLNLSLGFRV